MATTAEPMSVTEVDAQIARLWRDYRSYVTGGAINSGITPVQCLTLIDDLLDLRRILTA